MILMSLFTKSIFKEKDSDDGIRISVMSRHTLNDGVTPDLRITSDRFEEHIVILAPPSKLVGDYYKGNLNWQEYETRYLEYLRIPDISKKVKQLAQRASKQDITLLCAEDTAEKCHRRILAEECQRYNSTLDVIHR